MLSKVVVCLLVSFYLLNRLRIVWNMVVVLFWVIGLGWKVVMVVLMGCRVSMIYFYMVLYILNNVIW